MSLFHYNVLDPVKDNKLPFFDEKKGIFYIPLKSSYRHYVAVTSFSKDKGIEYFLLLSKDKFDVNCRLCSTDTYSRVQIRIRGELLTYIANESKERGNLIVDYIESTDYYDVYRVT